MSIALPISLATDDQPVVLEGVSWETYESITDDFAESHQHKRVTYDRGRMVILSPLPKHEKWKLLLGRFVEAIADERDIPISTFGSTTWKRADRLRGLEPDECFYIQHENQVRGKMDFDLTKDPPPDLAIEVDLRQDLIDKMGVYAALGIGEVWSFDGKTIRAMILEADGTYRDVEHSRTLPFLRSAEMKSFLDQFGQVEQNAILRSVRKWAKTLPL